MSRIIILTILATSLFSGACKKNVLDEKPKDFISTVNFYNDEQDAEAAVVGMYAITSNTPFHYQLIEVHSDYAKGRGSWASMNFFDQVMDQSQIARAMSFFWSPWYQTINRANTVLFNVPPIEMDETKKNSLLAEARFMRAKCYYDLVRGFGPVPLRTTPINDIAEIGLPRASEQEVYNLIIDDLKIAENDLPNSVGANTRRASKWAAKQLLADVYLTREQWDDAAIKAEEVINSGQYELVRIEQPDDFYKIFAVNTSTEDIMSLHFSAIIQDDYVLTLHLPNIPDFNNSSTGFFTNVPVMNSFIGDSWDNNDMRKSFNLYTEYKNSAGVTVPLPATTPELFKKFISWSDGIRGNSRPLFRYAEVFLIYAEASAMAAGAPLTSSVERLNIIKRRAYGLDPYAASAVDYPADMSLDDFRNAVIQERAYEFMHEQRRWWDLKRIGKAKEYIGAASGLSFIDARLLFPIPEDEINNNPMLTQADQNPGY